MNGWLVDWVETEQGLEQDFIVKCEADYLCTEHCVIFTYKPNECNYPVVYNRRVLSLQSN